VNRQWEWLAITLILLLAAVLRLWALGEVPPGLCHDEVAHWLIDRDILSGHHAIYFTAAYGHEPLYHYVQAVTVALFGDHWLGLRYPSVAFGLLGLAATYVLVRRLFGVPAALLAGSWLALSFWPLFYARVALRAISLPFTAALSAYFLLRATIPPTSRSTSPRVRLSAGSGIINWLLAGLFLGLSLYTYMSARVLPTVLIAFLAYLLLVSPPPRIPWVNLFTFLLTAILVSAPLVAWLGTHPGAEYRVAEVREPLDRLLAGDPSLVWQNLVANLNSFTFAGDPWPRQNIPGRPVFADPVGAALFYAGLLIALWRWRNPRYGLLLIWLAGALVPSIVTSDAPSSIRNILGLVVVFVFPALALVEVGRWIRRKVQDAGCRMQGARYRVPEERHWLSSAPCFSLLASCLLLLTPCLFLTARDYFIRWPQNDIVRFDYQTDLTAVAHRLDELSPGTSAAVAGLSVDTMDGPGLDLAARRDVRAVRLCDTRETLIVPGGNEAWLFVPQAVPFDLDLQARWLEWGAAAEAGPPSSFTGYRLSDDAALHRALQHLETTTTLPDGTPVTLPVSFGGRLAFLGYEWIQRSPTHGEPLTLLTYWRVEAPSPTALKIFVHLLKEPEALVAQHDRLGSPPRGWAAGDLIVQKHTLPTPADLAPGQYRLRLGVYDPVTNIRLNVLTTDRLQLPVLEMGK